MIIKTIDPEEWNSGTLSVFVFAGTATEARMHYGSLPTISPLYPQNNMSFYSFFLYFYNYIITILSLHNLNCTTSSLKCYDFIPKNKILFSKY